MIRTGEEYRESLRDGREVWMSGERVHDVTTHPQFKPLVDARARIYDMAHEDATRDVVSYVGDDGERNAISTQLPRTREDWAAKQRMVDAVFDDLGGVVTRVGDETVGEMWSLFDGKSVLDEVDPQWSGNIERHILRAQREDPFHVSANTDPKGDRSKRPQDQDPDMLLHVVRETDNGIVVRGAKYETAAAYSNQAFAKPTIANWGDSELSDYAVGFIVDMGSRGSSTSAAPASRAARLRPTTRSATASTRSTRCVVFDDVEIPWENVLFYRHTRAATYIRATLHRYSAFAYVQRNVRLADLMIGAALHNVRQTGLEKQQAVQEKLAQLACYREGIHAHLTAAIALAEESPGGLLMPNQSLLYTGRVLATSRHAGRDAHRARAVRRPDLRDARRGDVRRRRDRAVDGEVLLHQRALDGGGPAPAAGLRARPAQLRLRRPPAHVPALRAVAAVRQPGRGLPQLRLVGPAAPRAARRRIVRARARRRGDDSCRRTPASARSTRRDTYPEQRLDNDLCQAVVAGNTIYLRGQVAQDLDTRESVAIGDPAGQAERAMDNVELLLGECGATLADICKCTIYLTDIRYREPVYRVLGERLRGVFPAFTGLVVVALARPEWVVEVDVIAVLP